MTKQRSYWWYLGTALALLSVVIESLSKLDDNTRQAVLSFNDRVSKAVSQLSPERMANAYSIYFSKEKENMIKIFTLNNDLRQATAKDFGLLTETNWDERVRFWNRKQEIAGEISRLNHELEPVPSWLSKIPFGRNVAAIEYALQTAFANGLLSSFVVIISLSLAVIFLIGMDVRNPVAVLMLSPLVASLFILIMKIIIFVGNALLGSFLQVSAVPAFVAVLSFVADRVKDKLEKSHKSSSRSDIPEGHS